MIFKHRFLNLKLGRVKENFVVTKIELFLARYSGLL